MRGRNRHPLEVQFGGLRITDHPKSPRHLIDTFVRWEQVRLTGTSALMRDASGRVIRHGPTIFSLTMTPEQFRVAVRARKRYLTRGLRDGSLCFVSHTPRHWARCLFPRIVVAMILALGTASAPAFTTNLPRWFRDLESLAGTDRTIAWAFLFLLGLALLALCATMVYAAAAIWRECAARAETVRVDGSGIEVILRGGERISKPWSELQKVRALPPLYELCFTGNARIRIPIDGSNIIIHHEQLRLKPPHKHREPSLVRSLLPLLILCEVLCIGTTVLVLCTPDSMLDAEAKSRSMYLPLVVPTITAIGIGACWLPNLVESFLSRRVRQRRRVAAASALPFRQ